MIKKAKTILNKSENEKSNKQLFYHMVLSAIILIMMGFYSNSTEGKNLYYFLFFFLLTIYCLIKYLLSCKQKPINLGKGRVSLPIYILLGYLINTSIWLLITNLMNIFYGEIEILNQQILDRQLIDNPTMEVALIFDRVLHAPILEEIILRGLLLNVILFIGIESNIPKKYSILTFMILSAGLFGGMHASNNSLTFIGFMLVGLNFAIFYLVSGNIIVPIGIHFINNFESTLGTSGYAERIMLYISLLIIIIVIEYFSTDSKNLIKKWLMKSK